tara:strand:+ start:7382 stop:7624 length:243 start_codon:yes stop_codon:yes gene_type:complete
MFPIENRYVPIKGSMIAQKGTWLLESISISFPSKRARPQVPNVAAKAIFRSNGFPRKIDALIPPNIEAAAKTTESKPDGR